MKMKQFSLEPFFPAPIAGRQSAGTRRHQGIPGIEILPSGRLFAVWYGGEIAGEGPGNYVVLAVSTDCGRSWREIQVVAPPASAAASERAFDSTLWLDPAGRLWWFWSQCVAPKLWDIFDGRHGVWASVCDAPDTDSPAWSTPRRIAEGVMMNKPELLADGGWALPTALWSLYPEKIPAEYRPLAYPNLSVSHDNGASFELVTGADVPERWIDEHMMIERQDGSWWLLVRTHYGIGQAFSSDRGKSWHDIGDSGLGGPNSRFAVRRLKSGRLLLVNHQSPLPLPGEKRQTWGGAREKLTAWLSDDDGRSWYGRMMIDERPGVSYPDFTEGSDGFVYCIYDHERLERGEILLARFTEEDVAAGSFVTPGGFTRGVVSAFPAKK